MLPAIASIIGIYTIVRMVSFIFRNGERAEPLSVKIMAGVGILWTIYQLYCIKEAAEQVVLPF